MRAGFFRLFLVSMALLAIAAGVFAAAPPAEGSEGADEGVEQRVELRTVGLIGGMSWHSSADYYALINEEVSDALGGLHSAKILMYSVNFAEIEELQKAGDWEEMTNRMIEGAQCLEEGGADCVLICTNTMHKTADDVQANIDIPLLHIADATGEAIREGGLTTVGLLGTKYTMEQDFYKDRLKEKFGLTVLVPDEEDREIVHSVIFDELCQGEIKDESREKFKEIIGELADEGAQGVILGCTEIPLLISQEDVDMPVFDTTWIHAKAAADYALNRA